MAQSTGSPKDFFGILTTQALLKILFYCILVLVSCAMYLLVRRTLNPEQDKQSLSFIAMEALLVIHALAVISIVIYILLKKKIDLGDLEGGQEKSSLLSPENLPKCSVYETFLATANKL
ncbi:uncharacterized protein LOC111638641 [Centruroides sculpturatus]|uniref:uncharacterized protein LOC111638641 n=1 Tax=Centruroides sculpturatus TaxID=218467 RepID=UPI000C6D77F7|nr:uncharacterized protein LOC111638641 [Centruroides sculpturatus]